MSELNTQIKEAIDSFDMSHARELLRDAMKEANAETYYLASLVALDDDQKREFLEKAVALDPFHEKARQSLKQMNSVNNIPTEASAEAEVSKAQEVAQTTPPLTGSTVVATVRDDAQDTQLYVLPINTSLVRTSVRKGASVTLVERDDYADYFRVLYASPAGMVDGWVYAESLENVRAGDVAINHMDLPITEFLGHKRSDIQTLVDLKKKYLSPEKMELEEIKRLDAIASKSAEEEFTSFKLSIILILWGVFATIVLITSDEVTQPIGTTILCGLLPLALGAIWLRSLIVANSKITSNEHKQNLITITEKNHRKEQLIKIIAMHDKQDAQTLNRWKIIQREMRTDYEIMRDDQRRDMLMQAAINVGSTILTGGASALINRALPNNQTITHEVKYKGE